MHRGRVANRRAVSKIDSPKMLLACAFLAGLFVAAEVGGAEASKGPLWVSPVITPATPGQMVPFDVDLAGAARVWLVVDDSGDGFSRDWAAWVEPRFTGPGGERRLIDLDWKSASSAWGQVNKGRNVEGGEMRVADRSVPHGIGTHAHSVIVFDVPAGMTRLVGRAALDDGGARQGGGSVRFAVHAAEPKQVIARSAGGPVPPAEAAALLQLPDDLQVELFAGEPLLSSPSDIDVDASGRVWVCEVLNYRGKKETRKEGDRILVLEDTDGDGSADKQTVFHQGPDVDSIWASASSVTGRVAR